MRRLQSVWLALILSTGACASAPGRRGSETPPKEPLRGGIAEFQVTSYDGESIEGRMLLGATVDPLVIDGRFIPTSTILVDWDSVRVCGKEESLGGAGGVDYDIFVRPPRPEDIVILRPGYWYGRNIKYWLFIKRKPGPGPGPGEGPGPTGGPQCIEAEFVVRARGGRPAARARIHAVRTDKLPAPPDGGAPPAPKPPAPPPGAP
jgi:hypothetical protein